MWEVVLRGVPELWPQFDRPVKMLALVWVALAFVALARAIIRFDGSRKLLEDRPASDRHPPVTFFAIVYNAAGSKTVRATLVMLLAVVFAGFWDVTIVRDALRDKSQAVDVDGIDGATRRARFRIVVVSGEYFWKF